MQVHQTHTKFQNFSNKPVDSSRHCYNVCMYLKQCVERVVLDVNGGRLQLQSPRPAVSIGMRQGDGHLQV